MAEGETLYSLAQRYGTTVEELRSENAISGDLLRVGQLLHLPGPPGFRSEAAGEGESLAAIAQRHGLSSRTLSLANPQLAVDEVLVPGTAVLVPPGDGVPLRLSAGDSLLELAIRHGVAPSELLRANGLTSLGQAVAGEWLLLPVAVAAPQATAVGGGAEPSAAAGAIAVGTANSGGSTFQAALAAAPAPSAAVGWHDARQRELLARAARLGAEFRPLSEEFVMPLAGPLSSRFGWRDISVGGNRFHGGIDVAVDAGTPVAAASDGLVIRSGWIGAYGYAVYIEHSDGVQSRYAHLSELLVVDGMTVGQGDVIGLAGSTGASTGPHLHFEIRVDGYAVDPLPWLH